MQLLILIGDYISESLDTGRSFFSTVCFFYVCLIKNSIKQPDSRNTDLTCLSHNKTRKQYTINGNKKT